VDVAQVAARVGDLTEQECAPVTEARGVAAELVPGVDLRNGCRTAGHQVAYQQPKAVGAPEPGRVEAEFGGQWLVEHEQPRVVSLLSPPGNS